MFVITPEPTPQDAEKLLPGEHPLTASGAALRPCGKCDGVIFLTEKFIKVDAGAEVVSIKSSEGEALRYLRAMPAIWKAENFGRIGISKPHYYEAAINTAEIRAESEKQKRGIAWLFTDEKHCVEIVNTDKAKWRLYRVAEDIWAALYSG